MEECQILRVIMKKVEGTENDYELVMEIDDAFKYLSKKSVKAINNVSEEYVKLVQEIIRSDENEED